MKFIHYALNHGDLEVCGQVSTRPSTSTDPPHAYKKAAFNSRLIRFLNLFKRRAIYAQIKQHNSASFARFLRVFLCISFPRPPATLHFPATRAVIGLAAKIWCDFPASSLCI